ncbi:MAG: GNAT family N-acetyltransferase [Alphaproteobacteria bacterium]|nr:GNAT family N-acetyltransferase [Alphaproteobacteria bacterium]
MTAAATASVHDITEKKDADIRLGSLEVRLAKTPEDIERAQELRYQVFYEEMGAKPTPDMAASRRDFDAHDAFCDHLLLIDHARKNKNPVVGTYRLIRRDAAAKCGGFYSSAEYDVSRLIAYPGEILELGRSCIDADYRTGPVMQLLWRGLGMYIARHNVALMFGCASLPGTDPDALKIPLSYLYHHHLAPPALRAKALPERYVDMKMLPREAFDPTTAFEELKLDPRSGSNSLPPLIKGYIRVGGFVGDGAVVDHQFNTTDICIIVKTDLMTRRYQRHYNLGGNPDIALPVQ